MSSKKRSMTVTDSTMLAIELCQKAISLIMSEDFRVRSVSFTYNERDKSRALDVTAKVLLKNNDWPRVNLSRENLEFMITFSLHKVGDDWFLTRNIPMIVVSQGQFRRGDKRELFLGAQDITMIGESFIQPTTTAK